MSALLPLGGIRDSHLASVRSRAHRKDGQARATPEGARMQLDGGSQSFTALRYSACDAPSIFRYATR